MAYSAMAVANAFVRRAQEGALVDLTPMKLQKLMYYAQGWHLVHYRVPLIDDFFARWPYGPVIPSLYHDFKEYGSNRIADYGGHVVLENGQYVRKSPIIPDTDTSSWHMVNSIIQSYGGYSGPQLSWLTHQPGTAWHDGGQANGTVITNEELKDSLENSVVRGN
ncbi:hypothetical protein VI26_04710 [Chromobacterium sp. LK1]|uniref:Panacea domain-containing protein n=1 Tax=Chromobacterium sp. LK1 TaxID=1628193 RepID=UPI00065D17F1|nr:type II toxin-antitoxin system antitoxin SocA domain-containing protein [Chromobacterium sp. LK1]KMN37000.1 hypothetical protein VI26_04710 [Chromobacterium sp. LK1]